MEIKSYKYGTDRLPDTKENILRHREMSFIDIFLENSLPLSYKDISYCYDIGIIAKHVNRPITALISKENHPRPSVQSPWKSTLSFGQHQIVTNTRMKSLVWLTMVIRLP